MAMDVTRKFFDHLNVLGVRDGKIDLFIHSNGGNGIVPWRLVTLIREYAKEFNVLVPHRAFSAATLTALGADSIIMHPMGMLGPTDPTVMSAFNPPNPLNPTQLLGINVEDVTAYIALIKDDAGIVHEEEFVQAFNKLADRVHPLALGNVKRFLSQSRMMAKKLLSLHRDANKEQHAIDQIVDNLTTKLFFHGHPINRDEARDQLGLRNVQNASPEIEFLMWSLYLDYEKQLKMEEPFNPPQEFISHFPALLVGAPPAISPVTTAKLVYLESVNRTDVSILDYELSGEKEANGNLKVSFLQKRQAWVTE